jgi:hypothetical protein
VTTWGVEGSPSTPTSLTSRGEGLRNPFQRELFFVEPVDCFIGGAATVPLRTGVFGASNELANNTGSISQDGLP